MIVAVFAALAGTAVVIGVHPSAHHRGHRPLARVSITVASTAVATTTPEPLTTPSAVVHGPAARVVADRFAAAYATYLTGGRRAGRLPFASPLVRAELGRPVPSIAPSRARATGLRPISKSGFGEQWQATAVLGVDRRFPFEISLLDDLGRWRVQGVDAPDVDQALARPTRTPSASQDVTTAAGRFAVAYVDYAEAFSRRPPPALPVVVNEIDAGGDPLAGIAATRWPARLRSVRLGPPTDRELAATVVLVDAGRPIRFSVLMIDTTKGWQADGFLTP